MRVVILDSRDGEALCGLSNHKFFKGDFDGQGGCGCAFDFAAHRSDLLRILFLGSDAGGLTFTQKKEKTLETLRVSRGWWRLLDSNQ